MKFRGIIINYNKFVCDIQIPTYTHTDTHKSHFKCMNTEWPFRHLLLIFFAWSTILSFEFWNFQAKQSNYVEKHTHTQNNVKSKYACVCACASAKKNDNEKSFFQNEKKAQRALVSCSSNISWYSKSKLKTMLFCCMRNIQRFQSFTQWYCLTILHIMSSIRIHFTEQGH